MPWEQQIDPNASTAADKLSQLVAGNAALTTEPGLVQALDEGNATPVQAQAINQFLVGLQAEQKVRAAAAASQRIMLAPGETQALDQMGINYAPVYKSPQSAVNDIVQQMADKGVEPVRTADGSFKYKDGNIVIQPLQQPKPAPQPKSSGGGIGGFFSAVGHFVTHGNFDTSGATDTINPGGPLVQGFNKEFSWASATVSDEAQWNTDLKKALAAQTQNTQLATSLGYDPTSWFSMQAFKAAGYEHTDLSDVAGEWDQKFPNGFAGWDGTQATQQAALFRANPVKWRQQIENDPSNYATDSSGNKILTAQGQARLSILDNKDFGDLIAKVGGRVSSIGNEVANAMGVDPVKHPTERAWLSGGAEIAASFALDPLNFGINAASQAAKATVAIKNLADGERIRQILTAEDGIKSMQQANQIAHVNGLIKAAKDIREAADPVAKAQIVARTEASNPFAGYLSEFTGDHQVTGYRTDPKPGQSPFIMGKGKPIESYQEAVDYLASHDGFVRLTGGYAPVESRLMPGAMSSFAYGRFKGSLANWSAGRTATKLTRKADDYLGWAQDDPARLQSALNDGHITKLDPQLDDAMDPLTGEAFFPPTYRVTDAGLGALRRGELTFGGNPEQMSAVGKVLGWGTTGMAARARLALTRFGQVLPTARTIDIEDNSSVFAIRKIARTYLTSGHADLLAARYITGNAETRKTIVEGLKDSIAEAAGLTKTRSGRELVKGWKTEKQAYALRSDLEWADTNGTPAALWPGQVQTKFSLPAFGQVHNAAVKVGLYEASLGRMLSNSWLDKLMGQWKIGALARPVTATRAIIESQLNAAAEGLYGKGIRAKAIARDLGRLDDPGIGVQRLSGTEKLAQFGSLLGVARLYRNLLERNLTPEELAEHTNFPLDLELMAVHEQSALHQAANLDPAGLTDLTRAAELGAKPGRVTFNAKEAWDGKLRQRNGYELTDEVDGTNGADVYAHNLATRVNDAPAVAKAVIAKLKGEGEIEDVIRHLDNEPLMRHSLYGKKFKLGEQVTDATVHPDLVAAGKQQWAETLVSDMEKLLTGRNGTVNDKLVQYIRNTGKAPNADWILKNVKGLERPEALLRPTFIDSTFEGTSDGLIKKLYELEGRGYQRLVETPIQRHATLPLFRAATVDAKLGLNDGFRAHLIDAGMNPETADRITWDIAAGQGWQRVARMLDDPHMKTQLDIVGRGFFAFSRATTMMLRRWGGTFWRNPVMARRLQLAVEGSVQSGIAHKDENGDWVTSLPLSGVAMEALQHVMSYIPGFQGMVYTPTLDLQGRVATIIPGSTNPFQYSTTPMVSLSARWVASHFPEHREWFDHVDQMLNGSLGQGRGIADTLTPSLFKSLVSDPGFIGGSDPSGIRNQMLASAMVGQLYTMYAAGNVPTEAEMSDPAKRQHWLEQFKRGVMSNMFTKGIFGMFSPATLDTPEGSGFTADQAWRVTGARDLRAEFKEILNDVKGDYGRANAIWARLHPDLMVFTQSGSQGTTKGAVLPATKEAFTWLAVHSGFVNSYKQVAAYFMPAAKANEPFSLDAYHAEIEEGLRQRKTPDEFLTGLKLSDDISTYFDGGHGFPGETQYKQALAAASASGDKNAIKTVRQSWQIMSKQYQEIHPLFGAWLQQHSQGGVIAQGQIQELKRMVNNNEVPGSKQSALVLKGMLANYDAYEGYLSDHPADGTNVRTQQRQAALAMFQDYMAKAVAEAPDLTGIYNGVFRVLNSNLDPVLEAQ